METTDLAPSDPVFAMLLARHVAIVGFEPEEDSRLSAVLSEAGALCHSFQAQSLPLALRRCDIALVMVDELRPSRIETFSKPVVAAITANSLKYYSQWIRSSATDWFFCPATAEELLTRLTVVLQRQAGSRESLRRSNAGRAFCILLADDDPMCHNLFQAMVQGRSMLFRAVDNGRKALEVARDWQPDLVVLDVEMPLMDGFE